MAVTRLVLTSVRRALIQAKISACVGLPAVAIVQSAAATAGTSVKVAFVIVLSWNIIYECLKIVKYNSKLRYFL